MIYGSDSPHAILGAKYDIYDCLILQVICAPNPDYITEDKD